ncbi:MULTISPECIES: hypothetical protein [Rhodococcus]|uniref:hypothetical protein n=1 Tax=Rhodococcus TaxID=1827 RepID=UPI0007AEA9F9|nr:MULTISPECIES: hypothetical protein [Rhodococcus]KZL31507.1 hypothetical protein A3852_17925 [Rhodococcus qingshengii]MCE4165983.1 hypothetical protein [Rhodococcus sp. Ni2]
MVVAYDPQMSLWAQLVSGPAMGGLLALGGVFLTQRNSRSEKQRDREVQVEDKLREEVSELLASRATTTRLQTDLAVAWVQGRDADAAADREGSSEADKALSEAAKDVVENQIQMYEEHTEELRRRVQMVSLLTVDRSLNSALEQLRELTFGEVMLPTDYVDKGAIPETSVLEVRRLVRETEDAFGAIEDATRSLVANHGLTRPQGLRGRAKAKWQKLKRAPASTG